MNQSNFRKTLFGAIAAVMMAAAPATAQENPADKVIAVVEGVNVTEQDFRTAYASLPPRIRQQGVEKLYPHILEQLIQQVLIVKRGREANLSADPEVQNQLKVLEDQVIHNVYITREVQKKLTDDLLFAEYEKFVAANPPRDEVRARHILVKTEEEAREIIQLIGQGTPFVELAKTRSTGPSSTQGGDLGFFPRGKMVQEFEEVAFALEPNTYSIDPVQTRFGWHVILVEEKRTLEPPTFEQLRPNLVQSVGQSMVEGVKRDIVSTAKVKRFDLNGQPIEAPTDIAPNLLQQ